jgi:hypothetical protein
LTGVSLPTYHRRMPTLTLETFRQLVERVAREGMPVDRRRNITDLVKLCKVSRPTFYHALTGGRRLSGEMQDRIAKGLKRVAPWVTAERVLQATDTSRVAFLTRELNE